MITKRKGMTMISFGQVLEAWDADARAGGQHLHPFPPDSPEFWESGRAQASAVAQYAKPGARVIDFGAGNGRLAIPLAQMGYEVLAVDASQAMLDDLGRRAREAGVEVTSTLSDGSDLARILGRKKAAVVLARAVLIHHDYAGVERIVGALAKVLRKGGHLIADWPLGDTGERRDWIGVTTWRPEHRLQVAERAGLRLVESGEPSVWRKR